MTENININAVDCGQEKCLTVGKHENLIRVEKGTLVKFHNKLHDAKVEVVFYDENDKGNNALDNFCNSMPIANKLVIEQKKKFDCTVGADSGDFAYTVKTDPANYQMLDPIIIIEPSASESQSFTLISFGGLLIVATLLAFWLGARKSSSAP